MKATLKIGRITRTKPESIHFSERYAADEYSQNGEDGLIATIFEAIGVDKDTAWCVEIGAGDGVKHSNTRYLVKEKGWRGIMIEGHAGTYRKLAANYADDYPNVLCVDAVAGMNGDGLDSILTNVGAHTLFPVPKKFDFLSLDVDGCDWHLWEAMKDYHARVVLVEFNPTIQNDVYFVQEADHTMMCGSSLNAFVDLAHDKGYELVATVGVNALFVVAEDFPELGIKDNSIDAIHDGSPWLPVIFQDYTGTWVKARAPQIWATQERDDDG